MKWLKAFGMTFAAAYSVIHRLHRDKFWRVAGRRPDEAYEWFLAEGTWVVYSMPDAKQPEPKNEYEGPFYVRVPMLDGECVVVYAKRSEMRASQEAFLARYARKGNDQGGESPDSL